MIFTSIMKINKNKIMIKMIKLKIYNHKLKKKIKKYHKLKQN